VGRFNDYVFGGNLRPHSPYGKGCKLRILPIVLITGKYTICGGGIFTRGIFRVDKNLWVGFFKVNYTQGRRKGHSWHDLKNAQKLN